MTAGSLAIDPDDDGDVHEAMRGAQYRRFDIYDQPAWYDVDYAGYRGEEAFYRLVLQAHAKPGGVVVELGVGTGRLALRFAADGFHIHGVEPSAAMRGWLEDKRLRCGLSGLLSVSEGTAAAFPPPAGRVDVIMFPFNGLLHLTTRDELRASFTHVHQVLDDAGRFALDCTGPYWEAMLRGPVAWGRTDTRVHPQTGRTVYTCDRSRYLPATRQMRIDIRYLVEGEPEGAEVTLLQTMWTWQEVLAALEECGFIPELLHGDVDMAPFEEGSPRLLVSCRKR